MTCRAGMLFTAGALLLPVRAPAQGLTTLDLRSGTTVRVMRIQPGGHRVQLLRGRLQHVSGDTVVIAVGADSVATAVIGGVRALEVRTRGKSKVWQGLLVGTLAGATIGGVIGATSYERCTDPAPLACLTDFGPGPSVLTGVSVGGVAGGLLGAVIGSRIAGATWRSVELPRTMSIRIEPAPSGGIGMGIALRF